MHANFQTDKKLTTEAPEENRGPQRKIGVTAVPPNGTHAFDPILTTLLILIRGVEQPGSSLGS